MSATVVNYNGVTIRKVRFGGMEAKTLYDKSGVVITGVRKTIIIDGLLQQPGTPDFVADLEQVEADLTIPRRALTIDINGERWKSINASGTGGVPGDFPADRTDVASGPIPQYVRIFEMSGGRAARVSMTLQWTEHPDANTDVTDPVILSHRFSQSFGVGPNDMVTRTVSGVLILSGKFENVNPDLFRHYVLPVEIAGFQRQQMEFLVADDGNTLIYRSVDKEGYRPFPNGVLNAQMRCSVSQLGPLDSTKTKRIDLSVEGDKYHPKNNLIESAFALMHERLTVDDRIENFTIAEDTFGGNTVSISVEATTKHGSGGQASRFDLASTQLFRAIAATAGSKPAQGRFRQVQPYGQSLVRAAVQAMFYAPSTGRPANLSALSSASVGRYDQSTNRADSDLDGYSEDFTEDAETVGVDVTVAPLPNDYDGSELDTFLGSNDTSDGGTDIINEDHASAAPYKNAKATRDEQLVTFQIEVPTADPSSVNRHIQLRPPVVRVVYTGESERIGAPPAVFVPPELADTTRRWSLKGRKIRTHEPKPMANGADLVYRAQYLYVFEKEYDPSAGEWSVNTQLTYGASGTTELITYDGSQAIGMANNPTLNPSFPVEDIDPSIANGVYA